MNTNNKILADSSPTLQDDRAYQNDGAHQERGTYREDDLQASGSHMTNASQRTGEASQSDNTAPLLEKLFFNNRPILIGLFLLMSLYMVYQAMALRPDAAFEKMLPVSHPYIQNLFTHKDDLSGLGNAVRIVVETEGEDIFTREFQDTLKQIHDEAFFIPGVDRNALKSIWSPGVRWAEVTEEGFIGGPVIPDSYDGSAASLDQVRGNVYRSGEVGSLVANDLKSAIIYVPIYDIDPQTGIALDYQVFSQHLESLLRDKYQSDDITIHITGFAKVVGELIDGMAQVLIFFITAIAITALLLFNYSRCFKATFVVMTCSIIAVFWQLGLLHSLGYGLDPYSVLVPFLVFAIGVSHGVQIINGIAHESGNGLAGKEEIKNVRYWAARRAFRSLYIPGLTALVSDGIGFATLMIIDIAVIRDLAVSASIGVAVIVLTNLVLLPVVMSYVGVSRSSIKKLQHDESSAKHPLWHAIARFTDRKVARIAIVLACIAMALGQWKSQDTKIGDLDVGAPELRADSIYNQDIQFITDHYATSTDVLVVMVKTAVQQCSRYDNLQSINRLQWQLDNLEGVQSSFSLVNYTKLYVSAMNEGALKWGALNRNEQLLASATISAPAGLLNADCSLVPLLVFLNDHKAETLERVVAHVEQYAAENNSQDIEFKLAAGNAGIEAATNIVIKESHNKMLIFVYAVVASLCFITFRSFKVVFCIMVPLALTSLLCQVLMFYLDIGVKVATLPVIALGVGIGVDYGIYIYSKLESYLKAGQPLHQAYFNTLNTTGKAVAFTGLTLAIGVGTWVLSPIKFQADMGLLLAFMFVWNMVGAMLLLPALVRFVINPDKGLKTT